MPGFIGFTRTAIASADEAVCRAELAKRCGLMRYADTYLDDELYVDQRIACTRTHVGLLEKMRQPASLGDLRVWLHGEVYNASEIEQRLGLAPQSSSASLLASAFQVDADGAYLENVDGVFAAVVYDAHTGSLKLITDRHGLMPLHFAQTGAGLAWASEAKALLDFDGVDSSMNQQMLDILLEHSYAISGHTWLTGVQVAPPASVLEWCTERNEMTTRRYWSPESIELHGPGVSLEDAADEYAYRFEQAVVRLAQTPERVRCGVSLSGGLDSRVIADQMARQGPLTTLTITGPESSDRSIAAAVAKRIGSTHHESIVLSDDWMLGRLEMSWRLDGVVDIAHYHATSGYKEIKQLWDINLNGFLGDATVGGGYLIDGTHASLWDRLENRGRRGIGTGLRQGTIYGYERCPFMMNRVLDWAMGVAPEELARSRFYLKVLKRLLRPSVGSIPWQKTWQPAVSSHLRHRAGGLLKTQYLRLKGAVGLNANDNFIDYQECLNALSSRKFIKRFLGDQNALVADTSLGEAVAMVLQKPTWDNSDTPLITRALTIEGWLRCSSNPWRVGETLEAILELQREAGMDPIEMSSRIGAQTTKN